MYPWIASGIHQIYSRGHPVGVKFSAYYGLKMCPIWGVFSMFVGGAIFAGFRQPGVVGRSVPQMCAKHIVVSAYCTSFPLRI